MRFPWATRPCVVAVLFEGEVSFDGFADLVAVQDESNSGLLDASAGFGGGEPVGAFEQDGGEVVLVGTSLGTSGWVRVSAGLPDLVIGVSQNGSEGVDGVRPSGCQPPPRALAGGGFQVEGGTQSVLLGDVCEEVQFVGDVRRQLCPSADTYTTIGGRP